MTEANAAFVELGDKLAKATDPETPTEILGQLILDGNPAVSKAAAENPSTPAEALLEAAMLGGLVDEYVPPSFAIANHRNASAELLEQLAACENRVVRRRVASNRNTTTATLTVLSKDSDDYVQMEVARNPNTPVAILESLCHGIGGFAVAENPNANLQCLLILLSRGQEKAVIRRHDVPLSVLAPLAMHKKVGIRSIVAAHPRIDEKTLLTLTRDGSSAVRKAVAANENCSFASFSLLARDSDVAVVVALLRNPKCPRRILEHFACDDSCLFREAVMSNPSCPREVASIAGFWTSISPSKPPPRPPLP